MPYRIKVTLVESKSLTGLEGNITSMKGNRFKHPDI